METSPADLLHVSNEKKKHLKIIKSVDLTEGTIQEN